MKQRITPLVEILEKKADKFEALYKSELEKEISEALYQSELEKEMKINSAENSSSNSKPIIIQSLASYEGDPLELNFFRVEYDSYYVGVLFPFIQLAYIRSGYENFNKTISSILKKRGYSTISEENLKSPLTIIRKLKYKRNIATTPQFK